MRKLSLGLTCLTAIALMAGPALAIQTDFGFQSYSAGTSLTSNGWDCWNVGVTNNTTVPTCANQEVSMPVIVADPLASGVVAGPDAVDGATGAADWSTGAAVLLPGAVDMTNPTDPSTSVGLTAGEVWIRTQQRFLSGGKNIMSTFSGAYHGGPWQGNSEMKLEAFGAVKFTTFTSFTFGTEAELVGHRLQVDYHANMSGPTVTDVVVTDLDQDYVSTSSGWSGSVSLPVGWTIHNSAVGGATGVTKFAFHSCCPTAPDAGFSYRIDAIPEPGTIALLGFGGLTVLLRRRRRA